MHFERSTALAGRTLLCALACALMLASGCSDRRSEQFRGEGDVLLGLGRIGEAKEAYLRSEETNPANPMAQIGLARCAAASGEIPEALSRYESARSLDPALPEGYMEAVRLLVESSRLEEALALSEAFTQMAPEKGGLLHGAVLVKADRASEAVAYLERLREQFPQSLQVKLNLGVAYAAGDRPDDAVAQLEEVAKSGDPIASSAQMALIDVYESQGKTSELVAEFEKLASESPDDVGIQLGYARVLLSAGRVDEAETIARAALEKDPESGWANYIVGAVKLQKGSANEAVAFLTDAADALPDEQAVASLLQQAKTGEAPPQPGSTASATGSTGSQNWRDLWAQAALMRLVSNRDAYLSSGVEAREVVVLAAVFTQNVPLALKLAAELPEDSGVRRFLDAMETRDSKTIGEFFAGWKPEEPAQLLMRDNALGYALASGGSRGQALSLYLFCLERWPDNSVALFNIAQVFRALRQPVIAAQQLQRLIVQHPGNIDAHQMLYSALREGGEFDPARKAAEASFALFPEERWSFLYLTQAYLDTNDPELALQVLNRASGTFPSDPEIELVRGGVFVRLGDCAQAKVVLEAISSSAPVVIANRANLLALCAVQAADWEQVRALAGGADPAYWPDSLRLLNFLAELVAGDAEAARASLVAPGADEPIAGRLGLMLTSAAGAAVEGLNDEEQDWAVILGADPDLLVNYGVVTALQMAQLHDASWAHYQAHLAQKAPHIGLTRAALTALQQSDRIEAVPEKALALIEPLAGDPRVWLALADIRKAAGDADGEAEAISRAVAAGPDFPETWSRQAALLQQKEDFKGAAEAYRKVVELAPESAAASNNLAYMLLKAGGSDQEALEMAAKAMEQLPNNAGIMHTLGLAQLRTGDLEGSKETLTRASELDPANPTISFDYGRVLLELGDKEKAKERVRYALGMSQRAGLDFPERVEAEQLLGEME